MSKIRMKVLVPILCCGALLCSLLGALMVSGGITAIRQDQPTGVDAILERDGYLEGIWYPWLTHQIGRAHV